MNDPKMTFVVPVHGQGGLFLARCLGSLLDNQDYKNKNVIVVFDGKEEQMSSALNQQKFWQDDERVEFHTIPHGGAPKARNFGLSKADGDYVCFFDCDSMLRAGAITTWMAAFDEHPECGFVYGGYRFTMDEKNYNAGVPAKPFDEYLLTCNNYISSMNPIKRDIAPQWNEKLESLQDWDFWLRVVKSGVKGHYIKEFLVVTEPPSADSISGKSHANWNDAVNAVRDANGIARREMAITSLGAPFQGLRRARILGADYKDPELLMMKPSDYKAIVSMGYYVDSTVHPAAIWANANGAKKVIHFIGTDVLQLSCRPFREVKVFRETMAPVVDKMFANAPWLVEELKEMGIESELLYCPIDFTGYELEPYPSKFTIAVYRSDTNMVHSEPFLLDVARSCPDIDWKFFGGNPPVFANKPKNIHYVGTIKEKDMPEFIKSTSALVRITVHDGFPATVAEWIVCGRPVICNLPDMPFARSIDIHPSEETWIQDKENLIKAIRNLQRNLFKIMPKEKETARKYYKKLLDPEAYKNRMQEVCCG